MPSIAAPFAHEQVGGGTGQTVEDGVVRRADRMSKVGLRGPPAAEFREAAGGFYQVTRVHGASPPVAVRLMMSAFLKRYRLPSLTCLIFLALIRRLMVDSETPR